MCPPASIGRSPGARSDTRRSHPGSAGTAIQRAVTVLPYAVLPMFQYRMNIGLSYLMRVRDPNRSGGKRVQIKINQCRVARGRIDGKEPTPFNLFITSASIFRGGRQLPWRSSLLIFTGSLTRTQPPATETTLFAYSAPHLGSPHRITAPQVSDGWPAAQ